MEFVLGVVQRAHPSKIYRELIKHTLGAKHVAEMLAFEQLEGNISSQFLILGFLGPNIRDLKEKCGGKLELSTVLRIGIQTLCGIKMVHDVGYVHRHLRPSSFMLGNPDIPERSRIIYVTDFQIARRFLKRAKNNMGIYREEREPGTVRMHGYIRYVSVSVHNGNEHRCRDDIWSWIYIMAELLEGKLPWQNVKVDPTKVHALKMITPDSQLFATTKSKDPKGYLPSIAEYIRTVHADSKPDYVGIYRRLKNASNMFGTKFTDPYDWESGEQRGDCFLSESDLQRYFSHEELLIVKKGDQRVELDPLFFRDDSPPQGVRKARRIRQNTESLEIPSFIDLDITQQSQSSGASGGGASVRGSVKRTYRKDVSQIKKKMIIKESGGDGSGKKNNTFSKIKKKRSSKESRDNITANNNNNNDPRETMSFYSPKSPKSPLLSAQKMRSTG
uniref:Protein kinase domain-containing protein n=1 Tax=Panagrolaimus davidi TaxID=227884 RepID=A0A914P754_9BILA